MGVVACASKYKGRISGILGWDSSCFDTDPALRTDIGRSGGFGIGSGAARAFGCLIEIPDGVQIFILKSFIEKK